MTSADDPTDFDGRRFRDVLGTFPTGVTVVTSVVDGAPPVGVTIGSFTSVSLDPPLVAFLPGTGSESWPGIEASGTFCVNVLGVDQTELCNRFAGKGEDKFADVAWRPAPVTGSPILDGALTWIDCRIAAVHDGGDHHIVVGAVQALDHDNDAEPLLFLGGKYGRFDAI
ncbi:MAG: flavin reductase family protein [Actinomycetota bacterium]